MSRKDFDFRGFPKTSSMLARPWRHQCSFICWTLRPRKQRDMPCCRRWPLFYTKAWPGNPSRRASIPGSTDTCPGIEVFRVFTFVTSGSIMIYLSICSWCIPNMNESKATIGAGSRSEAVQGKLFGVAMWERTQLSSFLDHFFGQKTHMWWLSCLRYLEEALWKRIKKKTVRLKWKSWSASQFDGTWNQTNFEV